MDRVQIPADPMVCENWVAGQWRRGRGDEIVVYSPYSGAPLGSVHGSTEADVSEAVEQAAAAAPQWAGLSLKDRCQVMLRLREILHREADAISNTVSLESGKTLAEARAGVMKGIEVLEFALSLQNLDLGGRMEVSSGVHCEYRREPLGVVAGITPFNFPAMVPMWMLPIAMTLGNVFVWKPSDKTPLTSRCLVDAFTEAGLPPGVLTVLQGEKATAESILMHPDVAAAAFVGSTAVARSVYRLGTSHDKRVLALGGAKNHIILMPDADPEMAADGIVASFTGCAGQRCMAASVLLAVGDVDAIVDQIVDKASKIKLGEAMGAIITGESVERLTSAVTAAQSEGVRVRLDGRQAEAPQGYDHGYWLAPTILDHAPRESDVASVELFGPVLTIIRCDNLSQALEIENQSQYGNAASVFTSTGAIAERVSQEASAGMVGVNVGVPVPREPFSFGGMSASKFGHGDITGHGSLSFWTTQKKITTKWVAQAAKDWMS